MKILSRLSLCLVIAIFLVSVTSETSAQTNYPRISQAATVLQTIGDTDVMIKYHRPNVKGRTLWGSKESKALVPNGEVWRTGANEATIFEVSNDVLINGEKLPKGKYSFYAIPNDSEWTLIFNKSWNQGGTTYEQKEDALRVTSKPLMVNASVESMRYSIENVTENQAEVHLAWGKARIPFTINFGDVTGRVFESVHNNIHGEQFGATNYIIGGEMKDKYKTALGWMNAILANGDNYQAMFLKARLLGAMGMKKEAIATANKAVAYGKANNVNPGSIGFLESLIKGWM